MVQQQEVYIILYILQSKDHQITHYSCTINKERQVKNNSFQLLQDKGVYKKNLHTLFFETYT